MRVTFKLELKEPIAVSPGVDPNGSIRLGRGSVAWVIDSENKLEAISISFDGMPLKRTREGPIDTWYPELHDEAHRLGLYAANRVFLQTKVDAVPFQSMFDGTPSIEAETSEEEEVMRTRRHIVEKALKLAWNHVSDFNPSSYDDLFPNSEALADYCDALRVESPFLKFQQFFKVIEHFVDAKDNVFDRLASEHASKYDPRFVPSEIQELRLLRNRCTHPQHRLGHISSEKRASLAEAEGKLEAVRKLALIFLEHPL